MRIDPTPEGLLIDLESESETDKLARVLAGLAGPGTVVGLVGPLGAGKTRFVRGFAAALGVEPGDVTSPTYVLIQEYEGRLPVYHFDAYRLAGPEAFDALGAAEYWEAGGVCLVEWADLVAELLPKDSWWLRFESTGGEGRRVTLTGPDGADLAARITVVGDPFDHRGGQT